MSASSVGGMVFDSSPSHTSDLKLENLVATLPDALWISARAGWFGVSML